MSWVKEERTEEIRNVWQNENKNITYLKLQVQQKSTTL
jgi:hypothetical protein